MARILGVAVEDIIGDPDENRRPTLPASRLGKAFDSVSKLPRRKQNKIVEVVEALVAQNAAD